MKRPSFLRKPTFRGLRQSRTAQALREFVEVEFEDTDPEVRDPVDRGLYRTRTYMQRVFDGIQRRRDVGKQVLKNRIIGDVRSGREFVFGELLGSDYRPRSSRSPPPPRKRSLKRKVVR